MCGKRAQKLHPSRVSHTPPTLAHHEETRHTGSHALQVAPAEHSPTAFVGEVCCMTLIGAGVDTEVPFSGKVCAGLSVEEVIHSKATASTISSSVLGARDS